MILTLALFWLQSFCVMAATPIGETIPTLKEALSHDTNSSLLARIPVVVTYADTYWRILIVQDDTAGCHIRMLTPRWDFATGERLVIEGYRVDRFVTNAVNALRDVTLRRVGPGSRPKALPATSADLVDSAFAARLVEVKGTVRSIVEASRLRFVLSAEGKSFDVWVRRYQDADLIGLLDADVTLQGVCNQQRSGANGQTNGANLLVEDFQSIRVDRPGPSQPFAASRTPISALATLAGQPQAEKRLLVQGRVVEQRQGLSLSLRDETGEVRLLSPLQITLAKEDLVEAVGFLAFDQETPILKDAQFRVVRSTLSNTSQVVAAQADQRLPVLSSIKEVLALSRDQARQEYPLCVRGVVTCFRGPEKLLFVQDGDYGVYVSLMGQTPEVKARQLVEITGVTRPGGVLTMIAPARITALGDGTMPTAPTISYQAAMSGMYDSRRVKVQGVVQSTTWADDNLNIDLVALDGRFWCVVPAAPLSPYCTNLINAFVEVEGVCILNLDRLMAPLSVELRIQEESDIKIVEKAPPDPFLATAMSIGNALGFLPPSTGNRRVKVRGVATYSNPGQELYLQDASGAIRVQTDQTEHIDVGDELEVTGFRGIGENGITLRNAEYKIVGKGQMPVPTRLRASEVLTLANRERLLQIDARLQRDVPPGVAPELVLEDGQELFTARLEPTESGHLSPGWRANSLLRVTGICVLRLDQSREPRAFRLLVRGPEDVTVLQGPPWFTTRRIVALTLLLLVTVFGALGWVAALRRRVAKQTDQIRQRLESEAAAERRLALVWEASADGMRMTDANGIVVQVNQAYCQVMKKSRAELEGKDYLEVFRTTNREPLLTEYQDRFRRRAAAPWQELQVVLWNGESVWFEFTDRFIEHTASSPLLLTQLRDITAHKAAQEEKNRLQEQLVQAQKTESIGRLAGGVAHDFNNMLQVILGNTMLALDEAPAGSLLHDVLQEVQKSARRSADLTRQLLAFARKQTINPKILDLNETVASLIKMLQRLIGENIELVWIPGTNLWPVKIDPAQVDQILVNLCVNARDAIAQTGKITIRTSQAHLDAAFARRHPDCVAGDYVVLSVDDSGHGIDAATRKHLFEPFFTTKDVGKGTGLGLAMIYGITKQNHGFVDVHSQPNEGATFEVYLPRSEAPLPQPPRAESKALLRGTETILLVEDEEQILSLGRRILAAQGYQVLTAQSPDAAWELAQQHTGQIHLVISDVIMPGMNGKELKRKLETLRPGIPCIFMSGYTSDVIASHGVLEEGIHYLQKPFTVESLGRKVREVIDALK